MSRDSVLRMYSLELRRVRQRYIGASEDWESPTLPTLGIRGEALAPFNILRSGFPNPTLGVYPRPIFWK